MMQRDSLARRRFQIASDMLSTLVTLVCVYLCSSAVVIADDAHATWQKAAEWSAPEAYQAAAADDEFVYAISNTLVAKYDREGRQRLSQSHGTAKHLNSGFVHENALYCAHSNFPLIPERSEIKRLDLDSMELTTFKDFGNFGGSLTWAVFEDGHWWCNFARYGEANAETFLSKFSPDWSEVGRWAYPPEVTEKLRGFSLSGGIWYDGELLVTGHDEPVLYRLHLPKEGAQLKLIGTAEIPFSGQGIAFDPKTRGLIGIDRSKRLILLARPKTAEIAK